MARTQVSGIFRERSSRIARQVSRTAKSRSPNHKPVEQTWMKKQTPRNWSEISVVTGSTEYILTSCDISGASRYWPGSKCHLSCTECHTVWIAKVKEKHQTLLTTQTCMELRCIYRAEEVRCSCNLYYHTYCIEYFPITTSNLLKVNSEFALLVPDSHTILSRAMGTRHITFSCSVRR